jgi:hypothetical protein
MSIRYPKIFYRVIAQFRADVGLVIFTEHQNIVARLCGLMV